MTTFQRSPLHRFSLLALASAAAALAVAAGCGPFATSDDVIEHQGSTLLRQDPPGGGLRAPGPAPVRSAVRYDALSWQKPYGGCVDRTTPAGTWYARPTFGSFALFCTYEWDRADAGEPDVLGLASAVGTASLIRNEEPLRAFADSSVLHASMARWNSGGAAGCPGCKPVGYVSKNAVRAVLPMSLARDVDGAFSLYGDFGLLVYLYDVPMGVQAVEATLNLPVGAPSFLYVDPTDGGFVQRPIE